MNKPKATYSNNYFKYLNHIKQPKAKLNDYAFDPEALELIDTYCRKQT